MSTPAKESKPRERSPVAITVASLWAVALLLSLYGAPTIREQVAKIEMSAEHPWMLEYATSWMKLSDSVGFSAVREALDVPRSVINAPYLVLEPVEPVDPVDPPVVATTDAGVAVDVPDAGSIADAGVARDRYTRSVGAAKKRVLVVGASSIQFAVGTTLERRIPQYEGVKVMRFGKLATGLSRPDYFDWPKKIDALAKKFKPDLVIANFGGNGAQNIPLEGYAEAKYPSAEWDAAYAQRVTGLLELCQGHGADVVFVGMPNMRKPAFASKMAYLNKVQQKAAEEAGALWISTWEMSSMPDGTYRKSIEVGQRRGLMRTSDGIHYRGLGAQFVVDNVLQQIERRYSFRSKVAAGATAVPVTIASRWVDGELSYTAFVPRDLATQQAPVLFLLPGAGVWDEWPAYPHRKLQALSQKLNVVLVVPEMANVGWYVDGGEGMAYGRHFIDELVDDVTTQFNVSDRVGIAGQGTGGHAAMYFGLRHPERFTSISAHGGWMDLTKAPDDSILSERLGDRASSIAKYEAASPITLVPTSSSATAIRLANSGSAQTDATVGALHEKLVAAGNEADYVTSPSSWPGDLEATIKWHASKLGAR